LAKIPSPINLNRAKKDLGLEIDYKNDLENVEFKAEAENIRAKAVVHICEKIATTGGSDDELVRKVKQINIGLAQKIIQEIRAEGIE